MQESKLQEQTVKPLLELPELMQKNAVYRELLTFWAEAGLPFHDVMNQVGRDYVAAALKIEQGNQCKAARRIGVHRNTLPRHMWDKGEG